MWVKCYGYGCGFFFLNEISLGVMRYFILDNTAGGSSYSLSGDPSYPASHPCPPENSAPSCPPHPTSGKYSPLWSRSSSSWQQWGRDMVLYSQRLGMWEAQERIQECLVCFRKRVHSLKGLGWIFEQKEVKSQRGNRRRGERERDLSGRPCGGPRSTMRYLLHLPIPTQHGCKT